MHHPSGLTLHPLPPGAYLLSDEFSPKVLSVLYRISLCQQDLGIQLCSLCTEQRDLSRGPVESDFHLPSCAAKGSGHFSLILTWASSSSPAQQVPADPRGRQFGILTSRLGKLVPHPGCSDLLRSLPAAAQAALAGRG